MAPSAFQQFVIKTDGSTALTEVGNNFFLEQYR